MTNAKTTTAVSERKEGAAKKRISDAEVSVFTRREAREQAQKDWEKAGIGDAFIFGKVMTSRPDLLLELLQLSLPELHIRSIHAVGKEVDIKLSIDAHGVRLDVSVNDDSGRMIDVEMQLRDEKNIPRRMRYYSGAIDQTLLERGVDYNDLPDNVIVFITPFDPFGRNLLRYTFRNVCIEEKGLELLDGMTKVVLNAAGSKGDVSDDLKGFLSLVAGTAACEEGTFADRVQKQVRIARQNSKWRRAYMNWKMDLLVERNKGRDEGRDEGVILDQIDIIAKKVKKGIGLSEIADAMEKEKAEIRPVWEAVKKAAPTDDRMDILRAILDSDQDT